MENPKPIKRHPAIMELSKDHHFALLLIWKIREGFKKSIEVSRISRYAIHFFETDLMRHFKDEEEILFNRISPDNKLVQKALQDHEKIKALVQELKKNHDDRNLLEQFSDSLEKHIRFEERELFNYLQKNIPEPVLMDVASALTSDPHEPGDAWNDIFWETATGK